MSQKDLFAYMEKYLRFPNMKVRIVNYSNANWSERKMLDKYREEMGIPGVDNKERILDI